MIAQSRYGARVMNCNGHLLLGFLPASMRITATATATPLRSPPISKASARGAALALNSLSNCCARAIR